MPRKRDAMPASKIMPLFKAGDLHSGKGGPIVKNPKQAKAILLSELRKEGKDIPMADHLNGMKKSGKLKSKAMPKTKGY